MLFAVLAPVPSNPLAPAVYRYPGFDMYEVATDEIVRGYEYAKEHYVIIDDEDVAGLHAVERREPVAQQAHPGDAPRHRLFARVDEAKPSKDLAPALENRYYNLGVIFTPVSRVDLAVVYKQDKVDGGSLKTSNGTIGAATGGLNRAEGEGIIIQPMIAGGVETMIGVTDDSAFGPLMAFGLGGIHVELFKDVALELAPVTHAEARAMLGKLKGAKLFDGFRGGPTVDLDRLAEVICLIAEFAADHADLIAELDVNPLICAGERMLAVDALIQLRGKANSA